MNTNANNTKICMMQALVTEGVNPITAANNTSTGIPIAADKYRFFMLKAYTKDIKIDTCRPDTAIT